MRFEADSDAEARKDEGPRYNIDILPDGTKIATVDSVVSQANRMEPIFKRGDFAKLVPQIEITFGNAPSVSLMDVGHRIGDASVRNSELRSEVKDAFNALLVGGNSTEIGKLAPTSLIFGAWDSRGEGAKLPRIVQAIIRAWDVQELRRSAQYVPPVNYAAIGIFTEEESAKQMEQLSQKGFLHAPAGDMPGGVIARGGIFRDVTVNLIALRRLNEGREDGITLRRYILGLALIAATEPQDSFLRQGCLLVPDVDAPAAWTLVSRRGERQSVALEAETVLRFARDAADKFGVAPPRSVKFDPKLAREDLSDSKSKGKGGRANRTWHRPTATREPAMPGVLLIAVHFHDGRYHGAGDWPPAPARLFQALVAGAAYRGGLYQFSVIRTDAPSRGCRWT
jgi:CRISPR-associated protein Csb1